MFIPENLLEFLGFFWQKGEKKRLKRPIIREYHRHRGLQRTERRRKHMKSNTKHKQQKTAESFKEFLRKIIESSVFWKKSQHTHKMEESFLNRKNKRSKQCPTHIPLRVSFTPAGNKGNNFFSTEKSRFVWWNACLRFVTLDDEDSEKLKNKQQVFFS